VLCGVFAAPLAAGEADHSAQEAFFESKIRPILVDTCFKCHGGKKTSNGLRVGSREDLLKGGDSGASVVPGDPNKSLLIQALRYRSDDLKMPPDKRLPDGVIADFERWVRDGARWPKKDERIATQASPRPVPWAFHPVRKTVPPEDPSGWSATPIDRFIRAAQKTHGIQPTVLADKRKLLRRMYFDLVGLPPTERDVEAFLADVSPDATSRQVERLLASPEYGERWGRHWMDLVRYADTAGDSGDYPVPEAYLYRDYIIAAFNSDKPYNEFVREQIAGDLLAQRGPADKYAERIIATGFLAQSRRYAITPYDAWHLTLEDTIDTLGRTFLAMTMRCARCHDHKFDPIPTQDYYRLYGVFASTQYPYPGSEDYSLKGLNRRGFVPLLPSVKTAPIVSAYEAKLNELHAEAARLEKASPEGEEAKEQLTRLRKRIFDMQRRGSPPALPVAYAAREGTIADMRVQLHGEPTQLGEKVPRGVPQFLAGLVSPLPAPKQSGRLELADWIVSPRNPLTARVIVNRLWQYHFGRGLVETSSYFGTRGATPTHPELLDWLASSFVEHAWSIKWLHRLILASKTYQLASTEDGAGEALDAANAWYWRFQRQRLDAEQIRDAMLCVAGTLDQTRAGPHAFPEIEKWDFTQHNPFLGMDKSRHRSVYLLITRLHSDPFLGMFDEPDASSSTEVRVSSTVPQQALFLMNSVVVRRIAEDFAQRLCRATDDAASRIDVAHKLAYCRPALPIEIERGCTYVERYNHQAVEEGLSPSEAEAKAWVSYTRSILVSHEFFYVE
jgi:cytochrome c553